MLQLTWILAALAPLVLVIIVASVIMERRQ